jgi:PAS domain S-box-containing protein
MPTSRDSSADSWLRGALAGSDLAAWVWDVPSDTVKLSENWLQMLGEPPAEVTVQRKDLAPLVHPDDLPHLLSVLDSVRRGRTPAYDIEHRVRVAGGTWRWIECRGKVAESDAAGRPLVVTGTNADITMRRRAEELLAARELQLRLVSDSVPAMIVELDARDRIRYSNARYAAFFGKSSESLIGQTFAQAVDQNAWERYAEHRERIRAGHAVSYERTLVRPGQPEVRLHVQIVPKAVRGSEYAGCYLMAEDVTERQRLAKMKEDFIRSVTHEVRTPLQSVRAALAQIAAAEPSHELEPTVAAARANCDRLIRMVNDVLDYQRLRAGHRLPGGKEKIDLRAQVREAVAASTSLAREAGIELRVAEPAVPILLSADPDRVIQLVTNLVANALKHSAKGDAVDISIERGDGHARVNVRDRGPGVPADFQGKLFKQFARGQAADGKQRAGTGLGLAICKALAEQRNGRVGFAPAAGSGAVFWFELPV